MFYIIIGIIFIILSISGIIISIIGREGDGVSILILTLVLGILFIVAPIMATKKV